MNKDVHIEPEWKSTLKPFFEKPEFSALTDFIKSEYQTKSIYPPAKDIFRAFWLTPFSQVKVVILGQDPYHGEGQAHGLSFSVPVGVPIPPSLQNVYKEIQSDLGIKKDFSKGDLSSWAEQGVFLLNAILTVVANSPASHQKQGWEDFTDFVIRSLSDNREGLVFMLWGNFARSKKTLIDPTKHLILESPHPSPLSAHAGFFGNKHFSQSNDYLVSQLIAPIQW